MSQSSLMQLTLLLVLVRIIIDMMETLANRAEYSSHGVYGWPVRRTFRSWTMRSPIAACTDAIFSSPRYLLLVVFELMCAVLLFLTMWKGVSASVLLSLLGAQFLLKFRNGVFGIEGSDQMHFLILIGATIFYLFSDPLARTAAVFFIAGQAMVAYAASGLIKLKSPSWRRGTALRDVLNTMSFGDRSAARLILKVPVVSRVMCWVVIGFECLFPLAILMGTKTTLIVLACGVLFHAGTAILMGFNLFFWTFISSYPAIYSFAIAFQDFHHSRLFS